MTEQFDDENVMPKFIAGGFHLPLYQDPHELKRRRNRLAQRKHRQRTSTESSINRKRQHEPVQTTSATSKISTSLSWDATLPHESFTFFEMEQGESSSLMACSLPTPAEEDNHSSVTSPESDKVTSRAWQTSLQSLDMGFTIDISSNTGDAYYHQQYPGSAQEIFEQAAAHDISSPQSLLASLGPESMRTLPDIFNSSAHATSTSELDKFYQIPLDRFRTTAKVQSHASDNSQLSISKGTSERSSKLIDGKSTAHEEVVTLESRFDRVIKAVEEAGFESIDDLARKYYTAAFKEDSKPYWTQSRSRSRSLPNLLASLHESSKTWSNRDVQGYQQQITNIAESMYVCEFTTAKRDMMTSEDFLAHKADQQGSPSDRQAEKIMEDLWTLIADLESNQGLKRQKTMIREKVTDPNVIT